MTTGLRSHARLFAPPAELAWDVAPRTAVVSPCPNPRLTLDISRLLLRAPHRTPTGIDRVELAYARHLLQLAPARAGFVAALRGPPRPVSRTLVARLVEATDQVWQYGDGRAWRHERQRISEFLSAPPPVEPAPVRQHASYAQMRRCIAAAAVAVQSLPPCGLPGTRDTARPRAAAGDIYVNVSHSGVDRPALRRWLGNRRAIFLLHDLIPIGFPEFVTPGGDATHSARLETMMQPRHTIMVNSHATRAALMEYVIYKQQNSAAGMAELATAPIGVEAIFRTGQPPAWPSAQPYFVCVATIEPRKNHVFLLQLWQRLVALLGDAAPRLVLVGRRGWENENAIDMLERGHGMRDAVLECGALPDRLMAALIAGARAVLLPSLAEGFGLPVVEALALGTPVIASDLPALREIGGGIPEFLDPLDGRGWLAALHDYAQPDSPRRERQISALQEYRAPCWDQHFQAFDALARGASQPAAVLAPALC